MDTPTPGDTARYWATLSKAEQAQGTAIDPAMPRATKTLSLRMRARQGQYARRVVDAPSH